MGAIIIVQFRDNFTYVLQHLGVHVNDARYLEIGMPSNVPEPTGAMAAQAYKPVVRAKQGKYFGAALVGTHSVIMGWNVPKSSRPKKLLGFAVRRKEMDPQTGRIESMNIWYKHL